MFLHWCMSYQFQFHKNQLENEHFFGFYLFKFLCICNLKGYLKKGNNSTSITEAEATTAAG